jgi:Zn-dependent M28 family amino/carboxypeptidase
LNKTADFIKNVFIKYSDSVSFQEYSVQWETYKNVICTFGPRNAKRIIIGAHYDACDHKPGADDNASGVVGLLELARLLKDQKLNYRIDLVAYSLEEPPFFRTVHMGSYIHSKSLFDKKVNVYGMISLEMIGYYKKEKHTQEYPIPAMSALFGTRGNYIALIKKLGAGSFARKFCLKFKTASTIKSVQLSAPPSLEGIDFSDHFNYWDRGYSALMITDTSFYRNRNYHRETDTMDTLDFGMMGKVIDGVFSALVAL